MRPPPLWALLTVYSRQDQKEISNEFWYQPSAAPDLSTWAGGFAAKALYDPIATALIAVVTTKTIYLGADLIFGGAAGSIGYAYYESQPGTLSQDALPEDVSVLVQKDCASFARGSQGRWYFAGTAVTLTNGSYLNSAGQAAWLTVGTTLLLPVVDQGITYTPVHYSPKQNLLLPIKEVLPVALLATRRRRRFRF